jgi:RimJ/RimL family protein N-acetyltransferase
MEPVCALDIGWLRGHLNGMDVGQRLWDSGPLPRRTVADLVAASDRDFATVGYGLWVLRRGVAAVGVCGLRDGAGAAELLVSIEREERGQGLAEEAIRAVLARAIVVDGVVAWTEPGNGPAQRVLARVGLTPGADTGPWVCWRRGTHPGPGYGPPPIL